MFVFDAKQITYDIGGVTFGGQPGEHPTIWPPASFIWATA